MPVTANLLTGALQKVGGNGYSRVAPLDQIAAAFDASLRRAPAGLTPAGAAMFIGQQMQESLFFHYCQEQLSGWPSSWSRWKGRTFIGVTGRDNYVSCSSYAYGRGLTPTPAYFVDNPAALADPKWATLGGDWFFYSQTGLWALANAGNVLAVSQWINGGPRRVGTSWSPLGLDVRRACVAALLSYGDQLMPVTAPPVYVPGAPLRRGDTGPRVKALQQVYRTSFGSKVSLDGIFGPYTAGVTRAIQKANGLVVDGVVGPATLRFIWTKTKKAI